MSRGLGALQREILDTLDDAATAAGEGAVRYRGNDADDYAPADERRRFRGWVKTRGNSVLLAPGVYDLRASCAYLARKHDKMDRGQWIERSFSASFSRAVAGLITRGELSPIRSLLPIAEFDKHSLRRPDRIMELSDGTYVDGATRFVKRSVSAQTLTTVNA
jgi:hypothetical protein